MKIGIVGGGIAGLVAAYELIKKGHEVTVFERDQQVGGLVGTFEVGGGRLEKYYHHIFTTDTLIVELIEELGLSQKLGWLPSKVGFFHQGKIYNFVTPMDLLKFSPLGLIDRIRLGLVGVYLQRYKDWKKFEDVTAEEWIKRYAGKKAYDVVWGPLLRGKFGQSASEVSMVWFWGKIHLRFASRGKGMQKERLGYLDGSFGLVIDELVRRIEAGGGHVLTQANVTRIVSESGKVKGIAYEIHGPRTGNERGKETMAPFDTVIATVPNPVFMDLTSDMPEDYMSKLRSVKYQAAVCLVMTLKQSLSPIYWLNISDPAIPFVGAIEHTNFIDKSHYGDQQVLYLTNYLAKESPYYRYDKEQLLQAYLPHIRKINPSFNENWIADSWLFRDDSGQPIVGTRYSERIPDHKTPIEGLYLANTTQIYPEDRGMNYSVRLGQRAAILADAKS